MNYDIHRLGIEKLTPMQEEVLEKSNQYANIVLLSPTGSGKSLAYLLPLVARISESSDALQAIVLVPSRELAIQTRDTLSRLAPGCRCFAAYGGRAAMEEHQTLKSLRPQVVVATPGRLLDHLQKKNLLPEGLTTLVIDEFDKSLELGFRQQMSDILCFFPEIPHFFLLSATDNPDISAFLRRAEFYRIDYTASADERRSQVCFYELHSPQKDKLQSLYNLLCTLGNQTSIVFVNYRESAERVGAFLQSQGVSVAIYHGKMEQVERETTLYRFANGSTCVLVSTDLAARGLDIEGVDNVIHYHLPLDEKAYIHRNGRTARWEATGSSIMILGPEEHRPPYITEEIEEYALPEKIPSPQPPKWETLYIGKGKKDKVNRIDVVGFLCKIGGLEPSQLGRVDVLPRWAYAAVDSTAMTKLLKRIHGQKIKGMKTLFVRAK